MNDNSSGIWIEFASLFSTRNTMNTLIALPVSYVAFEVSCYSNKKNFKITKSELSWSRLPSTARAGHTTWRPPTVTMIIPTQPRHGYWHLPPRAPPSARWLRETQTCLVNLTRLFSGGWAYWSSPLDPRLPGSRWLWRPWLAVSPRLSPVRCVDTCRISGPGDPDVLRLKGTRV